MMIFVRKIAVSAAVLFLAASASISHADTISLGSFATGTSAASLGFDTSQTAMNFAGYTAYSSTPSNLTTPPLQNGTAATYALAPNGTWAAPSGNSTWIGSTPASGPGGTAQPLGYYQFNTAFSAAGGSYSGTMNLMGDDTVEVLLNGGVIVPFGTLGSDAHCADKGPSCTVVDAVTLNGLNLLSGMDANVFTFVVAQAGTSGFVANPTGMNFTTSVVRAVAPEPSSWLLFTTGLLGLAGMVQRRRPAFLKI
jgi:hypothetical protein